MDQEIKNEIQAKLDAKTSSNEANPVNELSGVIDKSKSFEEQAQDVATVISTKKALEDEGLVEKITGLKKEELTEAAKANYKKGQAKNKEAEKDLQVSLFGVYEGLASYIGLKRDLPQTMLKILMFFMQLVLGPILMVSGLVVGTINILMDGVNSIAEKFAALSQITQRIVKSLMWIIIAVMTLITINAVLNKFGIFIF